MVALTLALAPIVGAAPAVFSSTKSASDQSGLGRMNDRGFDPNGVKLALDTQVRTITGKVPPEVMAKVLKIRHIIVGMLPRLGSLEASSPELFVLERTATDYLPTSLQAYLNLPREYATRRVVQDGKTPKEILLDQLTLLENKMNEVADDVHRHDSDRLLANGRFLEERFGRAPDRGPASVS